MRPVLWALWAASCVSAPIASSLGATSLAIGLVFATVGLCVFLCIDAARS